MNKDDERFQKRLALYSLLATAFVAIITVLITLGFTWSEFNFVPPVDNSQINNSSSKAIQTFISSVQDRGNNLVQYSTWLLVAGLIIISGVIIAESSKSKSMNDKSTQTDFIKEIIEMRNPQFDSRHKMEGVVNDDRNYQSGNSEESRLKESLEDLRLKIQIEETKLEITKLNNELETEKSKQTKTKAKRRNTKRKKKSL